RQVATIVEGESANWQDRSQRPQGQAEVQPIGATIFADDDRRARHWCQRPKSRDAAQTGLEVTISAWPNANLFRGLTVELQIAGIDVCVRPDRDEGLLESCVVDGAEVNGEFVGATGPRIGPSEDLRRRHSPSEPRTP